MIQVDDLSVVYSGDPVFEKLSFTLGRRERCGLVGRNGSGKSTLFRLIVGQEKPDKGTIAIPKDYKLGYLDQHIRFTKPTLLEEGALGLPKGEEDCLYKIEAILFGLGFKEEDLDLSPHDFSGGYQLRLHLAKVLVSEPDCLLLDEPTNYLDIVSIRWFARFLQQWKGEFILISHDREFMDNVTTHTMGIHRKGLKKIKGTTVELFQQILLDEEVYERTRINLEKKRAHAQVFVERFGAKASKAAQAQSKQKMIDRIPVLEELKKLYHLDFSFKEYPFAGKKMLEADLLNFAYEESHPLIEDFSISIEKGERIAIIGKNGRGKSTILRLLTQELNPQSGDVKASDSLRIGYFGQTNIDRLHPSHTIEEEIATANTNLSFTEIRGICGVMMFSGDTAKKPISVLSGGEKSRVLLGKILAKPCNLLLLDEPTHHLDIESIEALIDALEDFEGSVVLVTHSELILKRLALNKIVICHLGMQDVFEGSYEEFLEKKGWPDETGSQKPAKSGPDPKEIKRKRAELINERSRILKPIELEIGRLEKKIIELEKSQEDNQKKLMEISNEGQSPKLQELLKITGEQKLNIEKLYQELDRLTAKYETEQKAFDQKLELLER